MEWISVKDKLPEKDGEYIVTREYENAFTDKIEYIVGIGYFTKDLYEYDPSNFDESKDSHPGFVDEICGVDDYGYPQEDGVFEDKIVTHWMELPEPPKN